MEENRREEEKVVRKAHYQLTYLYKGSFHKFSYGVGQGKIAEKMSRELVRDGAKSVTINEIS